MFYWNAGVCSIKTDGSTVQDLGFETAYKAL